VFNLASQIHACTIYLLPDLLTYLRSFFGIFRYWDSSYDEELMEDRVAMNLLFLQVKISFIIQPS